MVHGHAFRLISASLLGAVIAVLTTAGLYILLVAASFFVVMPSAARNGVVVGSLFAVIFAVTFSIAVRKVASRIGPKQGF